MGTLSSPIHSSKNEATFNPFIAEDDRNVWSVAAKESFAKRSLETKGNNPSKSNMDYSKSARRDARKHSFALMGRTRFPNKTMRLCGQGLIFGGDSVEFKQSKTGAHIKGLATCKNHKCPFCAARKEQEHIQRIKGEIGPALRAGKQIAFVTSTAGFYVKSNFKDRITSLSNSYATVAAELKRKFPLKRMRRIEDTVNLETMQPHYHIHGLLVFNNAKEEDRTEIENFYSRRWRERTIKEETVKKVDSRAQDIRWIEDEKGLAEYIAKAAAWEISDRMNKVAKDKKSKTWLEWFSSETVETFDDDKKKLALAMLYADYRSQTMTFSNDWFKIDEDDEKEEEESGETFAVVNSHSATAFLRFWYKGWSGDRLLKLFGTDEEARKDFAIICLHCDDYLRENPFNHYEAKLLMECCLRDFLDMIVLKS
jgi:hypothetical protein